MQSNRLNVRLLAFAFAAVCLSFLAACRKSPEEIAALISESEAAEIAEASVAERTAGATMPAVDMAAILETTLQTCGVPGDTSFQRSQNSAAAGYQYTFNLGWLVQCNDLNIPQSASVDVSGAGSFTTPHWSGSDQTAGSLTFTGLAPSAPDYVANGSYTLTGDLTGSLRRVDPTFACVTEISLTNLTLRKSDYHITGGTGTLEITASNGQGNSQTLSGTLVFNGDGTATVTVNGHSHTFQL